MESSRIEEIVRKVYDKAEKNCAAQSKYALSRYVEDKTDLSYRTVQRAFDLYLNGQSDIGQPSEVTINTLCKFLGFESYAAYINENKGDGDKKGGGKKEGIKEGGIGKLIIILSIVFIAVLGITFFYNKPAQNKALLSPEKCMTWIETHYEKVACDKIIGVKVEPIDPVKLANLEKIEVDITTEFFAENTNQPLIWYYKTKEGDIEYFTAPGLHPINGKTLNAITPYIIEKYVPLHANSDDSFIN